MKRNREQFNREPLNLKGKNCFQYSGLVHKKAIGVRSDREGKGVIVVTKKAAFVNKPNKAVASTKFIRGRRRSLKKISNMINKNKYRKNLKMVC